MEGCYEEDGSLTVTDFPLLSVKKTAWRWAFEEMFWFLDGRCNSVLPLQAKGITIWDEWATKEGNLGPIYGVQWRNFNGVDQIEALVRDLMTRPFSRRHLVTAWNPAVLPRHNLSPQQNAALGYMALAPCHYEFQCFVHTEQEQSYLSLKLNLRSSDTCLGSPFNIAQYAMLLCILAHHTHMLPYELIVEYGDGHVYSNHLPFVEQMNAQFDALGSQAAAPVTLRVSPKAFRRNLWNYSIDDLGISNYQPQPRIDLPVAV
jgi:thymidylate synthase